MLFRRDQIFRDIDADTLVTECHRCIDRHQEFQIFTAESRLLLKFSRCTLDLRLIRRIQLSRRDFQSKAVQGVPVLAHHQDLSVLCHRKNSGSAVMMDIVIDFLDPVRNDGVPVDL